MIPEIDFIVIIYYSYRLILSILVLSAAGLTIAIMRGFASEATIKKAWASEKASNELVTFNSLSPGKFEWIFRYVIFKRILVTDGWGISCEIALIWMSLDLTDDPSALVQVMAWCRQATSHYLSQCWPRSLSPYGVTSPQRVNTWGLLIGFYPLMFEYDTYCQTSNISHTKSQILNVSCIVLQLSLPNAMNPGVMSRMKM